jgi:putative ABC transport system ATP-binding protein
MTAVERMASTDRRRPIGKAAQPRSVTPDGIVVLADVIRIYRESDVETIALRGVDLCVEAGEFVAIMGRSGSGKTTLLNLVAGSDRPSAGQVWVDGIDLARADESTRAAIRGRRIGLVFQDQNLLRMLSVREHLVLCAHLAGQQLEPDDAEHRLEQVGLAGRADHRPDELSGGEQQRAALASALIADPPILLGDEITGELDSVAASAVLDVIDEIRRAGTTVILVTHDPAVAARADRIVELHDGRVVADRART